MKFRAAGSFQEDVGDVVFLDGLPRFFLEFQDPLEFLDLLLADGHDPDVVQPKPASQSAHPDFSRPLIFPSAAPSSWRRWPCGTTFPRPLPYSKRCLENRNRPGIGSTFRRKPARTGRSPAIFRFLPARCPIRSGPASGLEGNR